MKIGRLDTNKDILFVAEIGNNHEGDFGLAQKMIGLAASAGANAVKFQTYRTELFVNKQDRARFERLKSFELTFKQFECLSRTADNEGLLFLSTPLDLESATFLKDIVCAYKIASGDNNFIPLLEFAAHTGLPLLISCGLIDISEAKETVALIHSIWSQNSLPAEMALLHCITAYPAPPEQANIAAIAQLKKEFNCTIGYSDHTLGIEAALLALALGARIIEKHFTIDKNKSNFRDHQLSADPDEMKLLIHKSKEILNLLGSGLKIPQKSEIDIKYTVRRSIVARRNLAAGSFIAKDDIAWLRPANGLPPGQERLIIGKKLLSDVVAGEPILLQNTKEI